jgi:hypothetical protein
VTQRSGSLQTRFQSWLNVAFLPIVVFSTVLLFLGVLLNAQAVNGINGTLTDKTGAVIPGAHVTATNAATNVAASAVTSSEGTFTIVGLIPGRYSVAVDSQGFKRAELDVVVEVARMTTINVPMEVGATSETVEVQGSAVSLDTASPIIGTTLEPELVKTAPIEINGLSRQIDAFMYLAPGVGGNAGSHWINGGVTYENEVQFNGVPVAFVQFQGNQTYINPPYEAVSEFRVNTATFDAQYGLGQGAVAFQMASGTNQFHGDGFDILRNQYFDSPYFAPFATTFNSAGKPIPPVDQQNNYGFTLSGPILLPKIYNGKNRTFFYLSQDWFKQNQSENSIGTVPTVAMKNGDFSQFVNASGTQIPIYDPTTGAPFPGNIIPQSRFSALAKTLLPLIPNPNTAGIVSGLQSNELPAVHSVAINQHLWSYTVDHNISATESIHFSQWRDSVTLPSFTSAPIVPFSNPLQSGIDNTNLGTGFLLNYVKTINPRLVMTAGADWIGYITKQGNANQNVTFAGTPGGDTFPLIGFDGQNAPTAWGVASGAYLACCEGGLSTINNRMLGVAAVNNWLWTTGRHTFNFGGQFRHEWEDVISCQFCSGTYNFSQRSTSIPNSNDPNFGSDGSSFASFLLGLADSDERQLSPLDHLRNKEFAAYAEDEIRVNSRLTLNIGLRWDVMVPFTESNNQIIYVNAAIPDPGAGGIPGGATKFGNCDGCSGITRADIHWKYFQPRGGVAYRLNSKTVIRAGGYVSTLDGGAYEFGTSFAASFMSSLLAGTYLRNSSGGNVPGVGSWDTNPLPLPQPTPFSPSIGNGGVIFAFDPQKVGRAPYISAWNIGIQRELPWKMFLTANYVGNRAIHLPTTLSLNNQPNPSVLQYGALLGEPINSPAVVAAGFKPPYPQYVQQFGASATLIQALTPFPQYSGFFPVYEDAGTAFYNAVQLQVEKRFTGGLSFLSNLTMGRLMANTYVGSAPFSPNGLNAFNSTPEYVPSGIDQIYSQKTVLTYELPFGYGKKYLNSRGVVGQVLGGWQVSAIMTYSGGFPFGAYNSYNPLLVNSFDRPNIDPSVPLTTYNYNLSFNWFSNHNGAQPVQFPTNAFVNTGPWQLGDSLRAYSALRTPPLRDENIAAMKYFHIGERVKATLRIDYFNLFNRTQLQSPDNNSLDSTFGQVTNLSSQLPNRQGQATFRLEF